jgi:hypothetical protein
MRGEVVNYRKPFDYGILLHLGDWAHEPLVTQGNPMGEDIIRLTKQAKAAG